MPLGRQTVLLAMGFSVTTAIAAKGITVSYITSGRVTKSPPESGESTSLVGLFAKDDLETPDLVKVQMLTWTLVAVVIYLISFVQQQSALATSTAAQLPDIPDVLMVLSGLGQGAYLGGKLTAADVPAVASIQPTTVLPGQEITLTGDHLGASRGASLLAIASGTVPIEPLSWANDAITFRLPMTRNDGSRWKAGDTTDIGLWIDGHRPRGSNVITIAMPDISTAHVSPNPSRLVIAGGPFGGKSTTSRVVVGSASTPSDQALEWTNGRITIDPSVFGPGTHEVAVEVNGYRGRSALITLGP